MDWMLVSPPKVICWRPSPQCDGIWQWGFWEIIRFRWGHGVGFYDGISALIRRGRNIKAFSFSNMWGQSKKAAVCRPGRIWLCWHPDPGLSASRSVRKSNFCCLSHTLCVVLLGQPEMIDTTPPGLLRGSCLTLGEFIHSSYQQNETSSVLS